MVNLSLYFLVITWFNESPSFIQAPLHNQRRRATAVSRKDICSVFQM